MFHSRVALKTLCPTAPKRMTNSMAKEEGKAWKGLQTRVLIFVTEERYHQPMAMPLHFPASLAK